MRHLTSSELNTVAGGMGEAIGSLVISQPIASIPTLSFTFNTVSLQGMLTVGGVSQPIGVGHPPVHLP